MGGFGYWVGVCFTINYVIGSGILTLPCAFDSAGLLLASLVLTLITGTWPLHVFLPLPPFFSSAFCHQL